MQTYKIKTVDEQITPHLLKAILHRDKLHKKLRKSPNNPQLSQVYIKVRNSTRKMITKTMNQYYQTQFATHKNRPDKAWKIINEITDSSNPPAQITKIITDTGNEIQDTKEIADEFNQFFYTLGEKLASNIPQPQPQTYAPSHTHSNQN